MRTKNFNTNRFIDSFSADRLKNSLIALSGVSDVLIDLPTSKITVTYDPERTNDKTISNTIAFYV